MNDTVNSTAMPFRQSFHLSVPEEELAALRHNIEDLCNFHECCRTVANVLCGLMSQPRFYKADARTAGGEVLDTVCGFINELSSYASDAIEAYKPKTIEESQDKFFFITRDLAYYEEPPASLLSAHVVMMREVEELEFAAAKAKMQGGAA